MKYMILSDAKCNNTSEYLHNTRQYAIVRHNRLGAAKSPGRRVQNLEMGGCLGCGVCWLCVVAEGPRSFVAHQIGLSRLLGC